MYAKLDRGFVRMCLPCRGPGLLLTASPRHAGTPRSIVIQEGAYELLASILDTALVVDDREAVIQCQEALGVLDKFKDEEQDGRISDQETEREARPNQTQSRSRRRSKSKMGQEDSDSSPVEYDESLPEPDRILCSSVADQFLNMLDARYPVPKAVPRPEQPQPVVVRAPPTRPRDLELERLLELKKLMKHWRLGRHPVIPDLLL